MIGTLFLIVILVALGFFACAGMVYVMAGDRRHQLVFRRYSVYTRPSPSGKGTEVVMTRRKIIRKEETVVRRIARNRAESLNPDRTYDEQLAIALSETRQEVSSHNAALHR